MGLISNIILTRVEFWIMAMIYESELESFNEFI